MRIRGARRASITANEADQNRVLIKEEGEARAYVDIKESPSIGTESIIKICMSNRTLRLQLSVCRVMQVKRTKENSTVWQHEEDSPARAKQ